jgi:Flp pilus assembly protein TadD
LKPDDANIAFNCAKALNLAGDDKSAIEALQASLKSNPSQYEARFLLGTIYFRSHDAKDAQDQLEAALLLQSTVEATLKLAEVLIAQEHYSEAVADLTPLTTQASRNAQFYDLLAAAYTGMHKEEDARKAQQRADSLRLQNGKR